MDLRKFTLMMMLLLLLTTSLLIPIAAQDEIILTLGVQEWQLDSFPPRVFEEFQANHPGVKVVTVPLGQDSYFPSAIYNSLEENLEGAQKLANYADVLIISDYQIYITNTRQGIYLDLAPLVAGDTTINEQDFFPSLWEAFQWDRGMWALPLSASMNFLIYDADAFDEAGLAYPTNNWTLDDLVTAARELTVYDSNGEITRPGFATWEPANLIRALLGRNFYEDNAGTSEPNLTQPELIALLEQWKALVDEGIFNSSNSSIDYNTIPMTINGSYRLSGNFFNSDEDRNLQGVLIPGNVASSSINGAAVSAGTENPELAYELAKYLTSNVDAIYRMFGDTPARQSMVGQEPEDSNVFRGELSAEAQALIDQGTAHTLTLSDTIFVDYINWALGQMNENGTSAEVALQDAQLKAQEILQTAAAWEGQSTLFVATPVPTPVLTANEVALRFRLSTNVSPLPNREGWDRLISDFTASDPQVGYIELLTGFNQTPDDEVDCYYQSYQAINESSLDDPPVLNIDPFLDADPNFDRNDMLPSAMQIVRLDNRTWGLPIVIEPQVLWYDASAFSAASAFEPVNGWTISEFVDALQMLQSTSENDAAVFTPSYNPGYMNMLIAAFGGISYDVSTNPPTLKLSDPATIEAIRQALDLAKNGYIEYSELGSNGGGGGINNQTPIQMDSISNASWRLSADFLNAESEQDFRLTTFPSGTEITPVSYQVGAGYIDADTLNPEACYRWLSTIAEHPDLLGGMPARRSLLDSPSVSAAYNPVVLDFFRQYDTQLSDPNTMVFDPYGNVSSDYAGAWVEQIWIYQAFDHYILEDADLEQEFSLAEEHIADFRQCSTGIPEFEPSMSEEENMAIFRQIADCAIAVDPDMQSRFFFPEDE